MEGQKAISDKIIQPFSAQGNLFSRTLRGDSFENVAERGGKTRNQQFFFFSLNFFYCLREKDLSHIESILCKCFDFGPVNKCVIWQRINEFIPLPSDKILDWSKFKAFANDKIIKTQKFKFAFEKSTKHCAKKEKMLVTSIFSFFHNVFKSFLFQRC